MSGVIPTGCLTFQSVKLSNNAHLHSAALEVKISHFPFSLTMTFTFFLWGENKNQD